VGAVLTALIERWLGGADAEAILDEASVSVVRERVRAQGAASGLAVAVTERAVTIASELGHNQLAHARGGRIAVRAIQRAGVPGIEVIAADQGAGIVDPAAALRPHAPRADPASSLGVGLASVRELSDEIDFDVRLGEGTCVWARKFGAEVPRRKQVGIYGQPLQSEPESGDDAAFVRDDDGVLIALADGLGHGAPAREAARGAVETVIARRHLSLEGILHDCHEALIGTRGAVLALARIQETDSILQTASVGNVAVHLYGFDRSRRFAGAPFVLGLRDRRLRWTAEEAPLTRGDVIVMFTDGLVTAADIEGDLELLHDHPIMIAQQMFERFSRGRDDALVAVVR
jgi:anti-sigma regulatory factor (Ser/Thr protein kinase)